MLEVGGDCFGWRVRKASWGRWPLSRDLSDRKVPAMRHIPGRGKAVQRPWGAVYLHASLPRWGLCPDNNCPLPGKCRISQPCLKPPEWLLGSKRHVLSWPKNGLGFSKSVCGNQNNLFGQPNSLRRTLLHLLNNKMLLLLALLQWNGWEEAQRSRIVCHNWERPFTPCRDHTIESQRGYVLGHSSSIFRCLQITWGSFSNTDSDSAGPRWVLRFSNSNKLSGDASAAGPGTTHWAARSLRSLNLTIMFYRGRWRTMWLNGKSRQNTWVWIPLLLSVCVGVCTCTSSLVSVSFCELIAWWQCQGWRSQWW